MGAKHTAQRMREAAAQNRQIGVLASAQPEDIRARRTAAENAYTNVLSRLGAEGTYGPEAEAAAAANPTDVNESVFGKEKITSQVGGPFYREGGENYKGTDKKAGDTHGSGSVWKSEFDATTVDQSKFQKKIEGSAQFRIMSKLTAEAEQLVNREGPLYDEMLNNTQLPILESSAAAARENTEQLRRAMQRGGSARRNAMDAVQKIRAQERINSAKMQALSETRFNIDKWSRENAKSVLEFGQSWASNLGGIRESYQSAMDHAADLMTTAAVPMMFQAEERANNLERSAEEVRRQMHAEKSGKVMKWASVAMAAVATYMTGGAAAPMLATALASAAGSASQGGSSSDMAGAVGGSLAQGVLNRYGSGAAATPK